MKFPEKKPATPDFMRFSTLSATLWIFCLAALLGSSACNERSGTPAWDTPGTHTAATASVATPAAEAPAEEQAKAAPLPAQAGSSGGLRFIAYNVENWLTMDRYVDRKSLKGASKPENEKQAVVELLTRHTPDVIGVCEIGTAADLAELQERLKAAGLVLPHSHYMGGSDPTRRLGLLSRFPITSTAKPAASEYQLAGQTYAINRGILDATVQARGKSYRFLGVHLKSKREIKQADQEAMRFNEARLLRQHVDSIFAADSDARLVVYGDVNDTRPTRTMRMITGKYNDPTYLTAIPAKDSQQTAWTHHWALHDIYSRIDFVTVSRALRPEVDFPAAKIIDDAGWDTASDHRAILAIFR
jgi:endonuclease/exonuclease/phosphatase family metal-dependent hydrolase